MFDYSLFIHSMFRNRRLAFLGLAAPARFHPGLASRGAASQHGDDMSNLQTHPRGCLHQLDWHAPANRCSLRTG